MQTTRRRRGPKAESSAPPVLDMTKVIAAANKQTTDVSRPEIDMRRVNAAVQSLTGSTRPKPAAVHMTLRAEDAGRRSYSTRSMIPVRTCAGFYHGDFHP
jgi:hypothetical protein